MSVGSKPARQPPPRNRGDATAVEPFPYFGDGGTGSIPQPYLLQCGLPEHQNTKHIVGFQGFSGIAATLDKSLTGGVRPRVSFTDSSSESSENGLDQAVQLELTLYKGVGMIGAEWAALRTRGWERVGEGGRGRNKRPSFLGSQSVNYCADSIGCPQSISPTTHPASSSLLIPALHRCLHCWMLSRLISRCTW